MCSTTFSIPHYIRSWWKIVSTMTIPHFYYDWWRIINSWITHRVQILLIRRDRYKKYLTAVQPTLAGPSFDGMGVDLAIRPWHLDGSESVRWNKNRDERWMLFIHLMCFFPAPYIRQGSSKQTRPHNGEGNLTSATSTHVTQFEIYAEFLLSLV